MCSRSMPDLKPRFVPPCWPPSWPRRSTTRTGSSRSSGTASGSRPSSRATRCGSGPAASRMRGATSDVLAPPTWIGAREAIVDGEVIALDDRGEPDFALLQARIKGQGGSEHRHRSCRGLRLAVAGPAIAARRTARPVDACSPRRCGRSQGAPQRTHHRGWDRLLRGSAGRALEGIMAKDRRSPYVPGARSMAWQKVKIRPSRSSSSAG